MDQSPEYSVIIPAFNEEDRLEAPLLRTVEFFRQNATSAEVIVVDDGSRDGTSDLVADLRKRLPELRLIRLPVNRGKGYAVRTGVVNARGEYVLFADADGATPIGEVCRLHDQLVAGADIAIGSRAMDGQDVKVSARWYRKFIGRTFHAAVGLLTVAGFRDTQCGFKLFDARVAHDLFSRMCIDGFAFDVELLALARHRGYRVAEVPVNWTHQPGSQVDIVVDSLSMLRDLVRVRWRMLRGHYAVPHVPPSAESEVEEQLSTPGHV